MTTTPAPFELKPNKTITPNSLKGLLPFLKPYRWQLLLAGVLLVLAAGATLVFPIALKSLIDQGLVASDPGARAMAMREHFLSLFGVAMALGGFSAARFYMVSWLGERVTADLRNAVYSHVLTMSPAFFETTQTGEVVSRLNTDTTLVQTVVGSSLSMGLRNAVMGTGALIMLVWTNPKTMLWVLVGLVLVVTPMMWFGRRVRKLSRASQDRVADSAAIASEVLNAVPTVQSYSAGGRESARFADATHRAFQTAVRRTKARASLVAFVIIATSAALLWGLYQGTQAVIAGQISAGHLGQTVVYTIILASAFAVLGEVYGDILRAAGASERLMELLHAKSPVAESAAPVTQVANKTSAALTFQDINFYYPSRPTIPALTGMQLEIVAGETIALVGASGAGKTTVFQLLQRFYDPQAGAVQLYGQDLRAWPLNALRDQIAVVSQDSVIFSASALDNIRYGKPNATDAQVKAAALAAYASGFIEALPQGYDTFLGERGVRLSGGQRQRIAIARALLKDAPILLLDEATSALDSESEHMVQAALDAALAFGKQAGRTRTTVVIAHRLATIQQADRIVVLDAGRIAEIGTHAQLIAAGGVYALLAERQFGATNTTS